MNYYLSRLFGENINLSIIINTTNSIFASTTEYIRVNKIYIYNSQCIILRNLSNRFFFFYSST